MRGGNTHHCAYRRWRVRKGGPGSHSTPVVSDDHTCGESEALDHSTDIKGSGLRVVSARCLVACSIAAQVHSSGAETSLVDRWDLIAPCPPDLTKPWSSKTRCRRGLKCSPTAT